MPKNRFIRIKSRTYNIHNKNVYVHIYNRHRQYRKCIIVHIIIITIIIMLYRKKNLGSDLSRIQSITGFGKYKLAWWQPQRQQLWLHYYIYIAVYDMIYIIICIIFLTYSDTFTYAYSNGYDETEASKRVLKSTS